MIFSGVSVQIWLRGKGRNNHMLQMIAPLRSSDRLMTVISLSDEIEEIATIGAFIT